MKEKKEEKGERINELAQIIENSEQVTAWKDKEDDELIRLKKISRKNAKRLKELGFKFSDEYCWRISESQNLPLTFLFDSAYSSTRELPELRLSNQVSFVDENQTKVWVVLFSVKRKKKRKEERLFGLAEFGEQYDGVRRADVKPGFFALVFYLKRESENVG